MLNSPQVSVIMSVYNAGKFLAINSIPSILNQTLRDFEFIIVDDGSTDNSKQIIQEFSIRDKRIRPIFLPRNVGIPRARNAGLAIARGKYMAVMDAEDISYPERLQKQYNFLEENPDHCFIGCAMKISNIVDKNNITHVQHQYAYKYEDVDKESKAGRMSGTHLAFFCKMASVRRVGGYQPALAAGEDIDLFLRLYETGEKMINFKEVLVQHFMHGDNSAERIALHKATCAIAANWSCMKRQAGEEDFLIGKEETIELEVLNYAPNMEQKIVALMVIAKSLLTGLHDKKNQEIFYNIWREFHLLDKAWEKEHKDEPKPPFAEEFASTRGFTKKMIESMLEYDRAYVPEQHNLLWQRLVSIGDGLKNPIPDWQSILLKIKDYLIKRQQPTDWLGKYIKP